VSFFALPEVLWKQQVPVYEKAGVTLVPISVGDVTVSKTVPTNISTKAQGLATGEAIANWVIADSDASAQILFFNVPAYATLNPFVQGFKATVGKGCEKCTITDLEATIDQVAAGKVNDLIVSALQRNPDVDYVLTSGGTLIHGLPSALNAAGIKVTLAGGSATVEEQEYIRAGHPAAFVSYPLEQFVWQAVDAAARVSVGIEPPKDYGVSPFQVLTKEGITDVPSGVSYDFPKDFREQYKIAWQVG
jgi:ribose transport system substrate-binding protein